MAPLKLNKSERVAIEQCVNRFVNDRDRFEQFAQSVRGSLAVHRELSARIHFIKHRVKEPEHLREKLQRKAMERKQRDREGEVEVPEAITSENLYDRVNDLAGIRLIHLHTQQLSAIHNGILDVFNEQRLDLVEEPTASCWDSEYEAIYGKLGIQTRTTTGYSSVHYVVRANSRTGFTCELQVRTLTDEVWGEVSHKVNYPNPSPSEVCMEQLKALARFTTGCTRLVDAIFASDELARRETE